MKSDHGVQPIPAGWWCQTFAAYVTSISRISEVDTIRVLHPIRLLISPGFFW